jgi:hypothetical protein
MAEASDERRHARRRADHARALARRRRDLLLLGLAASALLGLVLGLVTGAGGDEGERPSAGAGESSPQPPTLPGGGREILPRHRVVGFYGAPQSDELGVLGIGSPDQAAAKLRRQARPFERRRRPVMRAFELIAAVASGSPGPDRQYRRRQDPATIDRYLRAARRAKAILILDLQPGHADFLAEARALERWLREPDVSLALDPEWSLPPGQVPGKVIGSTDAATVDRVATYLSDLVRRGNLPQKLLLVHQFTPNMVRDKERLRSHRGIALTLNVDGFGAQPEKIQKYGELTRGDPPGFNGFKLFYREDTRLMSPAQVLRLGPSPDVVVYE